MSDYVRTKAVRYLPTEANIAGMDLDDLYGELEELLPAHSYRDKSNYFEVTGTTKRIYIDYVLKYSYGDECGDFGKVRKLTDRETCKYVAIFKTVFPDTEVDINNFRLVDYCYYNCCEPDDYFDEQSDPFYDEV